MKKIALFLTILTLAIGSPAFASAKAAPTPVKKTVAVKTAPKKTTTPKKPTTVATAKGQKAPPPGYMELVISAQKEYKAASKKAKAAKNKKQLDAAEKAYSAALEKAAAMLEG